MRVACACGGACVTAWPGAVCAAEVPLAAALLQDWEQFPPVAGDFLCCCVADSAVYPSAVACAGYPAVPWLCVLADRLLALLQSEAVLPRLAPMPGYSEVDGTDEGSLAALTAVRGELADAVVDLGPCAGPVPAADGVAAPSSCGAGAGEDEARVCSEACLPAPCAPDTTLRLGRVLVRAGAAAVRRLLSLRHTVGSELTALPPPRHVITAAFHAPHTPGVLLSVGARALSKHAHRASCGFWGVVRGSNAAQNANSAVVLTSLLDGAVWVNTHHLPHGEVVTEVRVLDGYGARWSGARFRGFLEPFVPDGHASGWRH